MHIGIFFLIRFVSNVFVLKCINLNIFENIFLFESTFIHIYIYTQLNTIFDSQTYFHDYDVYDVSHGFIIILQPAVYMTLCVGKNVS